MTEWAYDIRCETCGEKIDPHEAFALRARPAGIERWHIDCMPFVVWSRDDPNLREKADTYGEGVHHMYAF